MRHINMKKQQGVSLSGLLMWSVILIFGAIIGMKLVPAFIEYAAVKKNLVAIVSDSGLRDGPLAEMRKSFDKRAVIDDIKVVKGSDIQLDKESGQPVLFVEYPVKTPLVANVFLYIEFNARSGK